jgi:UPF0755 protein
MLCGVFALGGAAFYLVPQAVQNDFGPPDPSLGTFQRVSTAWQIMVWKSELVQPVDPEGKEQKFEIRMGETANSVAARLQDAGLIRSGNSFRVYLIYKGMDKSIQAGEYALSPAKSAVEVAQALQDATPQEVEFNILPGWRAEEIAQSLPTSGLAVSPEGFLQVVQNPPKGIAPEGLMIEGSIEGFLFPGSYRFPRQTRADQMVMAFVARFNNQVDSSLRSAFAAHGLDLHQAVILASIIQREAVVQEEQPLIASVFYNRLNAGMNLESDPTVQYALGFNLSQQTWWKNPLTAEDLKVKSPYNTYENPGFPPGPISNPGLSALQAVAYPAQTPYLFFRAACDNSGKHVFAKTFDEHMQNGCP